MVHVFRLFNRVTKYKSVDWAIDYGLELFTDSVQTIWVVGLIWYSVGLPEMALRVARGRKFFRI